MLPVLVSIDLHRWFCPTYKMGLVYVSTNISKNFVQYADQPLC